MKLKVFLFLISFILFSNTNLFANSSKNVLILNSYHRGFQWSDDVLNGIESVLYKTKVNSTVLYMDSKRISSPKEDGMKGPWSKEYEKSILVLTSI